MEDIETIIADTEALLESCKKLDAELDEMNRCKQFLLDEYKTNKRWFRLEPGKTTIEDVIKTCFEFGWTSHNQFMYQ